MAEEIIAVNISLTGSREAVAELELYIDQMKKTGKVQSETGATSKELAKILSNLAKVIADNTKVLESYVKVSTKASTATETRAKVSKTAADASKVEADATKTLAGSLQLTNEQIEKNIYFEKQRLLAIQGLRAPTEANIRNIQRTTRELIVERDAIQATIRAQQDTAAKLANLAPRLNKFSLYVAGGVAGGMYEGIKQYMDFQKVMTQTFSQANVALSKQKALTQDVLNITKSTGRSYHDVADALYRVSSATSSWNSGQGATVKQLNALTTQAANLMVLGNVSGGANADAAARIIGAVANTHMKDFANTKDPIKQTKEIAAMLNAVVGSGDIRMTDLISALGRGVLTSAKSVGLGMKDAGAFLDLLTSHGVSGASAGTYAAHGFQLLTGSTVQNRQWQGAIGLEPGVLEHVMKTQGLGAAATMLSQHMNKLAATPNFAITAGMKQLSGQAAADYMMRKAQLTPEQIAMWKSGQLQGKNLNAAQQQTLDTIRSVEMTAMFGGGRQAMPLITLMQSLPQFQDIVKSITMHSDQKTYKKDLGLAMDTPANQAARLIRTMQTDLIAFGQKMTPVFVDFLKAGNKVLDFMGKFKEVFVPLGVMLAGTAAAIIGARLVGKGIVGARNLVGGASYMTQGIGHRKEMKSGDWAFDTSTRAGKRANDYANRRGIIGGSDYQQNVQTLGRLNSTIMELNGILRFLGSELGASDLAGMGPGRAGTTLLKGEQIANQYRKMTPQQTNDMRYLMNADKRYAGEAEIKSKNKLSEMVMQYRYQKGGGALGGLSWRKMLNRAKAETEAGGGYEGITQNSNAYKNGSSGFAQNPMGLFISGEGSATSSVVGGAASEVGDSVGKGILGRLKGVGMGAAGGLGRGMMGGLLGAGMGMMGGMGGGGVGGILGAAGGVASMFGPWGMAAGAALTMAPTIAKLFSGLFHSGPSATTVGTNAANHVLKNTTHAKLNKTMQDAKAAEHKALMSGDYIGYMRAQASYNEASNLSGIQNPQIRKEQKAANELARLQLLKNQIKLGKKGSHYFDINGVHEASVKIAGQKISADDYFNRYRTGGFSSKFTPELVKAMERRFAGAAGADLNHVVGGAGPMQFFTAGLHGRMPGQGHGVGTLAGENLAGSFFENVFTSKANRGLGNIGKTLSGFSHLNYRAREQTYASTVVNAAYEAAHAQQMRNLAKAEKANGDSQAAALHAAAAKRLENGAKILENAANKMHGELHISETEMKKLGHVVGQEIGAVLGNGTLSRQISSGITLGIKTGSSLS